MDILYNRCQELSDNALKDIEQMKEQRNYYNNEKFKIACDMAFNDIIKDYSNKLSQRSKLGYKKAEIFLFRKSDNIRYNGVYLLDLLKKNDLMKQLKDFFNPFSIYLKNLSKDDKTLVQTVRDIDTKYAITVSWFNQVKVE